MGPFDILLMVFIMSILVVPNAILFGLLLMIPGSAVFLFMSSFVFISLFVLQVILTYVLLVPTIMEEKKLDKNDMEMIV